MTKIVVDLGALDSDNLKVKGTKDFVCEDLSESQIRVLRVDYIVKRITQRESLEPMLSRFVYHLEDILIKVKNTGDSALLGEGMARHAESLFLSTQPGFTLTKIQKDEIRDLCEANAVEIPKGDLE